MQQREVGRAVPARQRIVDERQRERRIRELAEDAGVGRPDRRHLLLHRARAPDLPRVGEDGQRSDPRRRGPTPTPVPHPDARCAAARRRDRRLQRAFEPGERHGEIARRPIDDEHVEPALLERRRTVDPHRVARWPGCRSPRTSDPPAWSGAASRWRSRSTAPADTSSCDWCRSCAARPESRSVSTI